MSILTYLKSFFAPEREVEKLLKAFLPSTPLAYKTYSVGGYVRDQLLGIQSKDLDIVIEKEGGAEELSKLLFARFGKRISYPFQMGKSYPIWNIMFKKHVIYKFRIYFTKGAKVDFVDTQKECFPDPESRQRVTVPGTLAEDIFRRDFTVNELLRNLTTGEIVDLSGVGLSDLKEGILRCHPQNNMDSVFSDDPLRMLRLIRFHCKFGWTVPPAVIKAVEKNAPRIGIISGERIQEELNKIMGFRKLHLAIRLMEKTNLLQYIFPEVYDLIGVEQGREQHSEGDVYTHTLLVLEKAKGGIIPQLCALFHDIGKKKAFLKEGDKISFLKHELYGGEIAETIMRRLRYDSTSIEVVRKLVENHMRAHFSGDWGDKAVRKFVKDLGDHLELCLDLTEIDAQSALRPDGSTNNKIPQLRKRIKEASVIPIRQKPLIGGIEIMNLLHLKPSPKIGEIITWINEQREDLAAQGRILSKKEAIKLLDKKYGGRDSLS